MPPFAFQLLTLLAIAIAYGPLLVDFGGNLWSKPHYQHFPFVLLASGLLIARRLSGSRELSDSQGRPVSDRPRWTVLIYVVAWLLLLAAYQIPSPLLAAVSFIILVGGWVRELASRLGHPFPTGPWMLLWLLMPPPMGLDRRLIESLQRFSSNLSSQALDLFGIHHLMDGNALVLPDKQLFVDEACSGIISVISIVACSAIYGVWRRRAALHTILLMVAAAGWATLLNVVRITSIALAHVQLGLDWTEGSTHTLLGLTVFALSLAALIATDWFLHAVLAEVGPRWAAQTGEPIVYGQSLVRLWDWMTTNDKETDLSAVASINWRRLALKAGTFSLGVLPLVAFAGLGATQLVRPTWVEPALHIFPDSDTLAEKLQDNLMPESLLGLTLVEVSHQQREKKAVFGEHSILYKYAAKDGDYYLVSCDFPFSGGWHELSVCYRGTGWRVEKRTIGVTHPKGPSAIAEGEAYDFAQLDLTKPDGRMALVTFCACYEKGGPISAQREGFLENAARAFSRRAHADRDRLSFQVQVMAERHDVLSEHDRQVSQALLDEARRRFITVSLAIP